MCEKITLSVDGLTMRMMKYKRVNTNIMHRQRSEHGPTWWWCLQVKCQTIQHFLQLNIPFDLLDRLPFWLCDLPRLISHNQYLVCSSGRKIYYAVRIGCVWEKRDQRALLLYGLSKNSVKQQAIRLHWCRTLINLTLILTHHIASRIRSPSHRENNHQIEWRLFNIGITVRTVNRFVVLLHGASHTQT